MWMTQVLTRNGEKIVVPKHMVEKKIDRLDRTQNGSQKRLPRTGSMCTLTASGKKSEFCTPFLTKQKSLCKEARARRKAQCTTPQHNQQVRNAINHM